jgi:uncharacterized membrane-anchored protein
MTFTRREINLRYNLKNADRLCENAISYYNANKERISARRKELYAIKKAQAILESEERQRILAGYTEITVLKQFIDEEGKPMEIVRLPIIESTMLRPQTV